MKNFEGPDVVLTMPAEELALETFAQPNARRKRSLEQSALDLYAGNEKYLVRTALIRADNYDNGKRAPTIRSGQDAADLTQHLVHADQEHLVILALNAQMKLVAIHETAVGATSSVGQEIRHIIKVAVLVAATGVIMVHNHPSGDPTPSDPDRAITKHAGEAFECVGIALLDHVIVAAGGWRSFYQMGML